MTSFYQTKKKTKLRLQKHNNHWITKGIKKPSKRKQKFYKKLKNGKFCKTYKNLLESIKCKSKRIYYSTKILKFKNNTQKTWSIIK